MLMAVRSSGQYTLNDELPQKIVRSVKIIPILKIGDRLDKLGRQTEPH